MNRKPISSFMVIIICVALVAIGFLYGAFRGWTDEAKRINALIYAEPDGLNAVLVHRAYNAANLEKVAARHISKDDPLLIALVNSRTAALSPNLSLRERYIADERLSEAVNAVKDALEKHPSFNSAGAERDRGYLAGIMGDMAHLAASPAPAVYNEAASDFNRRMSRSVSGLAARFLFVRQAALFSAAGDSALTPPPLFESVIGIGPTDSKPAIRHIEQTGFISGDAIEFSRELTDAVSEMNKKLSQKSAYRLYIAAVRFLDGIDARAYGNALFSAWHLKPTDVLLVAAVGEDAFYSAMGAEIGKKISEETRAEMIANEFLTRYRASDFDGMIQVYARELIRKLSLADGRNLSDCLPPYFAESQSFSMASALKMLIPDLSPAKANPPAPPNRPADIVGDTLVTMDRAFGMSLGKILILILLFILIFNPAKRARKWGMAGCLSYGCGCAPLSWLFTFLGIRETRRK